MNTIITAEKIRSVLFGVATADALGVPVEFRSRIYLEERPVTDMIGYGTYNLPPGTWSDDSSMTFCLAEALLNGCDLKEIAMNFVRWYRQNYWTPRGVVFDIGNATRDAIGRLIRGERPDLAGGMSADSNGNGSLMRIAPLLLYIHDKPIVDRYRITQQVSSITHAHIRSVIACFYYLEFMRHLLHGKDKWQAYSETQKTVSAFLEEKEINPAETELYNSLLKYDISKLTHRHINSTGYVLHTLEAAVWCLLTTDSYPEAVLKAVNLGEDTDTVAAVTGGLAGLLYGFNEIPEKWVAVLARKEDIFDLCDRLANTYATAQ